MASSAPSQVRPQSPPKSSVEIKKLDNARKKEEKAMEKAKRAALIAQMKSDKDDRYILKKSRQLKAARTLLWLLLGFIFIKGVIVSVRPDPIGKVNKTIDDFKIELTGLKEEDNEIFSFAEGFAMDFFTYEKGGETDYENRLKKYTAAKLMKDSTGFSQAAKVIYAKAYRKEQYSKNQSDVFIWLEIEYQKQLTSDEGVTTLQVSKEKTTVKVPVYYQNNRYVVEDAPVFVNDDIKATEYTATKFMGTTASEEVVDGITSSLNSFFKAYYEEPQNVIDYYLHPDADKDKFMGLNRRVTFEKVNSCSVYQEASSVDDFIVLAIVEIVDKNGLKLKQNFNLSMQFKDKRYYIKDINTKITNLN